MTCEITQDISWLWVYLSPPLIPSQNVNFKEEKLLRMVPLWSNCSVLSHMILGHFWCDPPSQIIRGETVVHSLINKKSLQMHTSSQIIRGETVVHSLLDMKSLQMHPLSQIIQGETVVHSLINKESLQMHTLSQIMRGNCRTFYN